MSGRCRSCGRNGSRRHPVRRRRHRTVFNEGRFWMWVTLVLALVWVLSDMGVIK